MTYTTYNKTFFYLRWYLQTIAFQWNLFLNNLHVTDACTLHLFQSDPTPHFPFLRRSLLASLQDPYRVFQGEMLKPRPTHTPPVTDWPLRFGSHVLDACLQTLNEVTWYRRPFNAHRLILSQRLITREQKNRIPSLRETICYIIPSSKHRFARLFDLILRKSSNCNMFLS